MEINRRAGRVTANIGHRRRLLVSTCCRALLCAPLLALACKSDGALGPDGTGGLVPFWFSARTTAGNDWIGGTPAVDGGRVFVQEAYNLVGLDAATGQRLWSRRVRIAPSPGPTTLRAGGGRVFVSETDSIMAVDAATGATIWTLHPDSQAVTAPALDDASFYTGQRGIPVVYAVARDNGVVRWKVNVGVSYTRVAHVRGVGVAGDTVYAAVERYLSANGDVSTGVLVALDRHDGHELWRYETAGTRNFFLGAPVPVGKVVLVTDSEAGDLIAVDMSTHKEVWRTPAGGPFGVYVVGQTAFVSGADHQARAIDISTGAVRWTSDTGSSDLGYGACGSNFMVSSFLLRRFDGATGALTGKSGVGGNPGFVSYIATDGARGYVTASNGVFAFAC
jgi:outer membrane protein assembly factor BamB